MKIDPFCQRRNCSPVNVLFHRCTDYVVIGKRYSASGSTITISLAYSRRNMQNASQTAGNMAAVIAYG